MPSDIRDGVRKESRGQPQSDSGTGKGQEAGTVRAHPQVIAEQAAHGERQNDARAHAKPIDRELHGDPRQHCALQSPRESCAESHELDGDG